MSEKIVKTILIIEDEDNYKETLASFCQKVHNKLYENTGKIILVDNKKDAISELKKQTVHFASVDLRLEGDTWASDVPSRDLRPEDDTPDSKLPGGIQILKEIYDKKLNTISIVLSGEPDPELAALTKKYGALTFQQKGKTNFPRTYLTAVEAALLYVEAREFLDTGNYKEALRKWKEAKKAAKPIEEKIAEAGDWSFPKDIEEEIRTKFKHPVTHLPTSFLIENELAKLVTKDEWVLLYIQIEHLDKFVESQGHIQSEVLLVDTKDLLQNTFTNQLLQEGFFGQTSDNIFVIIPYLLNPLEDTKFKNLINNIKDKFEKESLRHYDFRTREAAELAKEDNKPAKMKYVNRDGNEQTSDIAFLTIGFVKGQRDKFYGGYLNRFNEIEYTAVETGDIRDIDKLVRQTLR